MLALASVAPATATNHRHPNCLVTARHAVVFYRSATWRRQDDRLAPRTHSNYSERRTRSCTYTRWLGHRWYLRARAERTTAERYESPFAAIRHVFGPYAGEAWEVAKCEGGSPVPSVNAQNGQYLGFFQMGDGERSRYGHSETALGQAVAAHRYFAATGRSWRPWECKP